MSDDNRQHGLSVELIDGRLVIAIGIEALMTAVRGGDYWDDEEMSILNANALAASILHELEAEQDDGTTPVHLMIDAAAKEAINQGSLAIGYDDDRES